MLTTKIQETVMTGERKILTLKRKSPPEHQEKTVETLVPLSRKKIRVEAKPNPRKKKKATEPVVETTLQLKTAKNETPAIRVKEPTPIKPPRPKRTLPYDEAVSIMQVYWPGLFEGKQPRLLKINIREDLYHDIEQRELPLSHKVLRRCLKSITRSPDYLSQIHTDAPRYNLDGVVEGHVNGVLRRNPRFFRHLSFSPATSASRSIISLLLWKM